MRIRNAKPEDFTAIEKFYAIAKEKMIKTGNLTQWKEGYPSRKNIEEDFKKNALFILEDYYPFGVFTFIIGEEPTYKKIQGAWLNDEEYGTLHRIASSGVHKGIFSETVKFCERIICNIRIDTHADNKIMQHLIEKSGFKQCGIITVADGTERFAYQKTNRKV